MKLTLITNIRFIQEATLRLDCCAVLVEDGVDGLIANQFRVRGFGPDGAWQVFTLWLDPGAKWDIGPNADSRDSAMFMDDGGKKLPLFTGKRLCFTEQGDPSTAREFFVQLEDSSQPIDVQDVTEIGFPGVWAVLSRKAAEYWTAPNMPYLNYAPRAVVRGALRYSAP